MRWTNATSEGRTQSSGQDVSRINDTYFFLQCTLTNHLLRHTVSVYHPTKTKSASTINCILPMCPWLASQSWFHTRWVLQHLVHKLSTRIIFRAAWLSWGPLAESEYDFMPQISFTFWRFSPSLNVTAQWRPLWKRILMWRNSFSLSPCILSSFLLLPSHFTLFHAILIHLKTTPALPFCSCSAF